MSQKCQACHQPPQCKLFARVGRGISERCVDCHMPNQQSRVISIQTPGKTFHQSYRNHTIAIYPAAAKNVLQTLEAKGIR